MNKKDELQNKIEKLEELKREKESEVNDLTNSISLARKDLGEYLISQLGITRGTKVMVKTGHGDETGIVTGFRVYPGDILAMEVMVGDNTPHGSLSNKNRTITVGWLAHQNAFSREVVAIKNDEAKIHRQPDLS